MMKTFKKLLMAVLVIAVVVCGVCAVVSTSALSADEVTTYVFPEYDPDMDITKTAAVHTGADKIAEWGTMSISADPDVKAAISAKSVAFFNYWLGIIANPESVEPADVRVNSQIITWLNYAAKRAYFDEESQDYLDMKADFDDKAAKVSAAIEGLRHVVAGDAPLSEYDCANAFGPLTFEDETKVNADGQYVGAGSTGFPTGGNGHSDFSTLFDPDNPGTVTTTLVTREKGGAGGGYYLRFKHTTSGYNSSYQTVAVGVNKTTQPGAVIEFDFMPDKDAPLSFGAEGGRSVISSDSSAKSISWFTVGTGLSSCQMSTEAITGIKASQLLYADCAAPGEWTRFTIVIDAKTNHIKYYVNYVLIKDEFAFGPGVAPTIEQVQFRIGNVNDPGVINLDNFRVYYGTTIREADFFEDMTDVDKFEYYASNLYNEELTIEVRLQHYAAAQAMITNYYDGENYVGELAEELKEAVDTYVKFEEEMEILKANILAGIQDFIDELENLGRGTANVKAREIVFSNYNTYLDTYALYLNQSAKAFIAYSERLAELQADLDFDNSVINFGAALDKFAAAPIYMSKSRYLKTAQAIYDEFGYAVYDKGELPSPVATLEINLIMYRNALKAMEIAEKDENSRRIIALTAALAGTEIKTFLNMTFVNDIDNHASEDCIRDRAIFDDVVAQINVIHSLMADGAYNLKVEGMDSALAIFRKYDSAVGTVLAKISLEHLRDMMALYKESVVYTEKKAICNHILNYIVENDIALDDEILAMQEACIFYLEEELPLIEANYAEYLKSNARLFIDTVGLMAYAADYSELSALYEKALALYYYMDVNDAEIEAAIAAFEPYEAEVLSIRSNSALFVAYVSEITTARTNEDKYNAIAKATGVLAQTDAACEGMTEALARYNKALADYQSLADVINAEIKAVCETVVAQRNCFAGAVTVVAVFSKKYF